MVWPFGAGGMVAAGGVAGAIRKGVERVWGLGVVVMLLGVTPLLGAVSRACVTMGCEALFERRLRWRMGRSRLCRRRACSSDLVRSWVSRPKMKPTNCGVGGSSWRAG